MGAEKLTMTGTELHERRMRLGLSLAALSRELDVPKMTIWRWETGYIAIRHARMLDLALSEIERRGRDQG